MSAKRRNKGTQDELFTIGHPGGRRLAAFVEWRDLQSKRRKISASADAPSDGISIAL
jgi:hypothetical protein